MSSWVIHHGWGIKKINQHNTTYIVFVTWQGTFMYRFSMILPIESYSCGSKYKIFKFGSTFCPKQATSFKERLQELCHKKNITSHAFIHSHSTCLAPKIYTWFLDFGKARICSLYSIKSHPTTNIKHSHVWDNPVEFIYIKIESTTTNKIKHMTGFNPVHILDTHTEI